VKPNPGHIPAEAKGKRVRVNLVRDTPGTPPRDWPADGQGGCRWSETDFDFDIANYEVI